MYTQLSMTLDVSGDRFTVRKMVAVPRISFDFSRIPHVMLRVDARLYLALPWWSDILLARTESKCIIAVICYSRRTKTVEPVKFVEWLIAH